METHTVLSQLSHSKHLKSVCVKLLIKGSTVVGTTRKTYQLILGDEQGSTIHPSHLQNFEVAYAFGVTRVTRYRHQINLSDSSIIFKIPPLSFCHYYRFQTFENIQRGLAHPKFSIGGFKHVKTIDGFSRILFEPDDVPEIQSFRMRIPYYAY
uniref:DUF223 domain-containing protein n=1 Tax=Brassica oleracea TaxID=3712 RepID=A0A3P6GAN2_BRAOL|nr:unnamed protein product [Brassica oleracea]